MALSEHQIQKSYFDWAKLHPQARRAFAIPNGGQRNKIVAAKLKAEGVRAGVLDVFLPIPRGGCHGMWIEFKAGKNGLTAEQKLEASALAEDGYLVIKAWDAVMAIDATKGYLDGAFGPGTLILKPARQPV